MVDAITGICIIDKRSNCPPGYTLIDRTAEGEDADLWKDGIFRSKTTRYICYTRNITASQWNHILTNITIIGLKDVVPQGFTALRETIDTKESALRKHVLCIKLLPKTTADAGITDFQLMRSEKYKDEQYTCVGEINGINLVFKSTRIQQQVAPTRPAPPVPVQSVAPLGTPPPIPQRPHPSASSSSLSKQEHLAAISGIPFKLHDRLTQSKSGSTQDELNITVKTKSELDETFNYDFSRERGLMAR